MDIRWKRLIQTCGILLVLPGPIFAIGALCASVSTPNNIIILTLAALTLGAGIATFWHAQQSIQGNPSSPLKLLPLILTVPLFAFLFLFGLLVKSTFLFAPVFLTLAVLPPLGAVAWFTPGNHAGLTQRRGVLAFCGGATISVGLAIMLEILVPGVVLALVFNFWNILSDNFNRLANNNSEREFVKALTNPVFIYVFVQAAIIAPLVEELVKPLVTLPILRQLNRQEAFWVGALAGAGFAAVENIIYAVSGLPIWAGVLAVRAIGGALHPLGAGLMALGWHAVLHHEPKATETWFKQYGFAVLLHAIWNGGSLLVIAVGGAQFFGQMPNIGIAGFSMTALTLAFLLILGIATLWLGRAYGHNHPLTGSPQPTETEPTPDAGFALSDRATALWALTCLLALVPIGIAGLKLWLP